MRSPVATVALNALFLDPGRSGGPETLVRQLVPALAGARPGVRFVLYTTRSGARALRREGWGHEVEIVALRADDGRRVARTLAEQAGLPLLARERGADVLHSLASVAPVRTPMPAVVTLHDVTFLRTATFSRLTTFGMGQIIARAARRADALVADSSAARDEICSVLKLDPARFTVVPLGPGRPPVEPEALDAVQARHELTGRRAVLCVAAKRPHKNQAVLVRALASLPDDMVLVLAGHPEPYDAELRSLAAQLGVSERVRFLDYVPDRELEALYRLASCVAVPSLGEGFGLPVLEAMRRGVPVACSDLDVLHEVAGEAARRFDARDPAAAAAAVLDAAGSRELAERGRRRAGRFSWAAAAEGTFEAYERAVAAAAAR